MPDKLALVTRQLFQTSKTSLRMKVLLLLSLFLLGNEEITRRNFFEKLRIAYHEGRGTKEEKRIIKRRIKDKARRQKLFDRNVKTLIDGIAKRLRHKPSAVKFYAVAGVGIVVWLCYKGSIGCDGKEDDS